MTNSHHRFNSAAKPKTPPPFSLRLTFEERAQLEKQAAGMSLGAFIRSRLFGEDEAPRRTRGKFPVKDHEALARVLEALGSSRISSNLNQLAKAANSGSLPITPETEEFLAEACEAVQDIRNGLLRALGHIPEDAP
ncbi:MAG: plasmid mobilization relaxosome protein MobC [Pseudomonadota bacterium]